MNLNELVKQRQELQAEIKDLQERVAAINATITRELGAGYAGTIAGYSVSVGTRRTFQSKIAEKLLDKQKLSKKAREALLKPATYDSAKVKALYPDIWEKSLTESDPFVTVK